MSLLDLESIRPGKLLCKTILLATFATLGYAQFGSSITGTVADPSGAFVPKAAVTLLNTDTNVTAIALTDETGNYRFVSLAPGKYRLTAEARGFAKGSVEATLETNQSLNLPFELVPRGTAGMQELRSVEGR